MPLIFKNVSFYIRIIKKSAIQNYNYVIKIAIQTQFMSFYIRKLYKFMSS